MPPHSTISRANLSAALIIGSVGTLIANTIPVFLSILDRTRPLTEQQVGLVASADLAGIAAGSIATAMCDKWVEKIGWKRLAALGCAVLLAGNLLSLPADTFELLITARGVSGLGAGMALAIVYAALASGDGARNLAVLATAQLLLGAAIMKAMSLLADSSGFKGPMLLLAVLAAFGVVAAFFLPRDGGGETAAGLQAPEPHTTAAGLLGVCSVLLFFTGLGTAFAYMAIMGISWGGSPQDVEQHITYSLIAAILGFLAVVALGSKFGYAPPLYTGYAFMLLAIALLAILQPIGGTFVALACVSGAFSSVVAPYQFEAITSEFDSSPATAMLVNAATLGGSAIGPAAAAYFAAPGYFLVNVFAFGSIAASAIVFIVAARLTRRVRQPAST